LFAEEEKRVVAETYGAARCGENFAFDAAIRNFEDLAIAGRGEDTVVACCSFRVGSVAEGPKKAKVVAFVSGSVGWGREMEIIGVACGADAGCSVEGVNFEAGVVGDDDFAGCAEGIVDGFEACVAFEGGLVFGWSGDLVEVWEWGEGDVMGGCGGEVAELAGV
jgi:hypothetical protein